MTGDEDWRVTNPHTGAPGKKRIRKHDPHVQTPVNLLYVDADRRRQRAVRDSLEGDERDVTFEVRTVADYETALDRFERRNVDCVVSAYRVDGGDGLSLLEHIRESACDLPVVLLTSEGSEQLASEAIRAGVTDYLPYDRSIETVETLPDRIIDAIERERTCVVTDRLDGIEEAIEHAADAVVITDREGNIEYVNPAFEDITGYTREEAINRNPRILKSGKQDEDYYETLWETILDGQVWEEEILNQTKSGETYVAHQSITPVTDCDGNVRRFVAIQRDVTRQKQLETQVENAAETLSQVYDVTSDTDLTLRAKLESVLEIATRHLEFPVGYVTSIDDDRQHMLAAVGDHEKIHTDATDPLERTYCRHTIEQSEPVVLGDAPEEGWENDPAYEQFGLRCYLGARVMVDGEPFGTLCFGGREAKDELVLETQQSTVQTLATWVGYEIERHQHERTLERQNERLEEFASVVSHDLRNPLNVAKARIEMARETGDDKHLNAVVDAHDRIESIIEDTLTLARQGDIVETTTTVSLAEMATDCWDGVETAGATLQIAGDTTFDADRDRLRHVFENLFRNAIEHAGTQVTVEVGPTDAGFYVEDDGPGIDTAERDRVFESGYTSASGTGFGLAIVGRITEAHGWSVTVTESESGGARFEFETTLSDGDGEEEVAPLLESTPRAS